MRETKLSGRDLKKLIIRLICIMLGQEKLSGAKTLMRLDIRTRTHLNTIRSSSNNNLLISHRTPKITIMGVVKITKTNTNSKTNISTVQFLIQVYSSICRYNNNYDDRQNKIEEEFFNERWG